MAITINELKQIIIEGESEWIHEVHEEQGIDSTPYIQGMVDEINDCKTIDDLVNWYEEHGYDTDEAYECIIGNLMEFGFVTKK